MSSELEQQNLAVVDAPSMDDAYGKMRLFPLYLVPFEHFLYLDSRSLYPMTFVISMRFFGQVDREAFLQALHTSLDRHRVLRSTIERKKQGRLSWVYRKDLPCRVFWCREGEPIEDTLADCPTGIEFDTDNECGVRVWAHQGDEQVEFTFYYNHVAVDGIGAHFFMGDLFAIYANLISGPGTAKLGPIDPTLLKARNKKQRFASEYDAHGRTTSFALKYGFKNSLIGGIPFNPPKLPKQKREPNRPRIPLFGIEYDVLSKDEHKKLRDVAIAHGGTVNDILAVECFMLMENWNQQFPKLRFKPGGKYRILLPTNLRGRGDDEMPAVNMTSYNFLQRGPNACRDRIELMKSIRAETSKLKNQALGTEFIEALIHAASTKWALPLVTSFRRGLGSMILTSVGDPTKRYNARLPRKKGALVAGNLVLDDFTGAPPLRHRTRASIAITTYQRKLTICLRCDPYLFDQEHTTKMINMFMSGLRSWFENDPPNDD